MNKNTFPLSQKGWDKARGKGTFSKCLKDELLTPKFGYECVKSVITLYAMKTVIASIQTVLPIPTLPLILLYGAVTGTIVNDIGKL